MMPPSVATNLAETASLMKNKDSVFSILLFVDPESNRTLSGFHEVTKFSLNEVQKVNRLHHSVIQRTTKNKHFKLSSAPESTLLSYSNT